MDDKRQMTALESSAATDEGQSNISYDNSLSENNAKIKSEIFTSDELRMKSKLMERFPAYLENIGRGIDGSDCFCCPSCGMYAYVFSNGTEWMCEDCDSGGDILDYCVMAGLFSDRRTALTTLCKQYGIKRSELEMVSADELMAMQFEDTPEIIKGLLCTGLTMIYGSPKVGKSWLVLQMAVAVSKGEDFWDRKTLKGKVVYLALEDTYRRLKNRLSAQTDTIDSNLQFVIDSEMLGSGLEMQLHNLLQTHPDTKLIIIDTFQRIRNANTSQYSYADDYREVDILKQFASQHEIAIILVHHKRKMKAADPLDEVSGTNGLTGSADTLMILNRKKRTGRTGKLIVSGRDLPGEEYEVAFSDSKMCWELLDIDDEDDDQVKDIISTVANMIDRCEIWRGTATELLKDLRNYDPTISIRANRLSAILFESRSELLATYGIKMKKERTNRHKLITLCSPEVNLDNLKVCDSLFDDDEDYDDYEYPEYETESDSLTVSGHFVHSRQEEPCVDSDAGDHGDDDNDGVDGSPAGESRDDCDASDHGDADDDSDDGTPIHLNAAEKSVQASSPSTQPTPPP